MDIQSIYLFLWLKIPLLSEKLVERCGLLSQSLFHLMYFPSAIERQQFSVPFTIVQLSYLFFCGARLILPLCPLRQRAKQQRACQSCHKELSVDPILALLLENTTFII